MPPIGYSDVRATPLTPTRITVRSLVLAVLLLGLVIPDVFALVPDRRKEYEDRAPNEYLIIPAVASLPGIGVFVGIISSFSNVGDSGIDVAATVAESVDNTDIHVQFVAIREIPLLVPGLTLEYWYGHLKLGNFQAYLPGRNSPNFTIPITAEFDVQLLRPIWRVWERRISVFYSLAYFNGFSFDDDGNEHPFADHDASAGFRLDFTDDEVSPRKGVRFSYDTTLDAPHKSILGKDKNPGNITNTGNDITVKHYDLVAYIPFNERFTLAWDNQYFTAEGGEHAGEVVAGGSPPLRGYPEGRWSDRYGVFSALEGRYTWPMGTMLDIYVAHGVLEGLQLAVFYEVGQVNPTAGHALYEELHESYGAGIRALFSAIVLRLEFANSDEGLQSILTIDQPF
jgi:hypothetical protein